MTREGHNPTVSPQAATLETPFPPAPVSFPAETRVGVPLAVSLVCRHRCTPRPVRVRAPERAGAEPWPWPGSEVALPAVCGVLRSTPVCAQPQIQGSN